MPEVKDHYKTLGVAETASADEIKKAYRKLARTYHPDQNQGDKKAEERFKEVQDAYDTLHDAEKRKQYDLMRKHPFGAFGDGYGGRGQAGGRGGASYTFDSGDPFGGFGDFFSRSGAGGQESFGDVFGRVFSGQGGTGGPQPRSRARSRPRDTSTDLRLSFDQALRGGKTEVQLPGGEVIRIDIPRGVASGLKIRLKGHGEAGAGGKRGDLYVTFVVEPSPTFRREGDDLYLTATIPVMDALLGTSRSITNAYGQTVKLPIAAGTQPGEVYRLKGQGVESAKGKGDLYVEVHVAIPKNLTAEQQETLRKAAVDAGLLQT